MNSLFYDVESLYPRSMIKCHIMSKGKINLCTMKSSQLSYYTMHYRLWDDIFNYFKNVGSDVSSIGKECIKGRIYLKICERNGFRYYPVACFLCDYCASIRVGEFKCKLCPGYVNGMDSCLNGLYDEWLHATGDELLEVTKQIRDLVLR